MNVNEYIDNGLLQDYCLGVLTESEKTDVEKVCGEYPEVQAALVAMQQGIEAYVVEKPIWRKAALKAKIWDILDNINTEETLDINNLPLVNKYSDHNKWLQLVKPMLPDVLEEDTFLTPIRANDQVVQLVAKTTLGHLEETHDNMYESFLILEGECICRIGDNYIPLSPGGFIEIPLYEVHNVKVTSPVLIAIVQRIAV